MKTTLALLVSLLAAMAQSQHRAASPAMDLSSNLPQQKIGPEDLIGISVYDAPELTRTVRVSADGTVGLPMLKARIQAGGLMPVDVESAIASALQKEEILVSPVVTVSVMEYRSRPISVVGAVKKPVTFQVAGSMRLLEAISRAEGLTDDAGNEILLTLPARADGKEALVRRIPVKALIDAADPELNYALVGGEEIRVPAAGKIFVVGNVKKPGSFAIRDSGDTSVLKALAVSEGLMPYASQIAYIYRRDDSSGSKKEIPVELSKIMKRKSSDVTLEPNDILYVPDRSGKRVAMTSLERLLTIGTGFGSAAILVSR